MSILADLIWTADGMENKVRFQKLRDEVKRLLSAENMLREANRMLRDASDQWQKRAEQAEAQLAKVVRAIDVHGCFCDGFWEGDLYRHVRGCEMGAAERLREVEKQIATEFQSGNLNVYGKDRLERLLTAAKPKKENKQ